MTDDLAPEASPEVAGWIVQARGGDTAALGRLLDGFRQYLLLVANQELADDLRPKAAASDLVQDTFERAHRGFAGFEGHNADEFRAWLRCILLNALANLERDFRDTGKRALGREVPGDVLFPEGGDGGLPSRGASPSGELQARERDVGLRQALDHLPEDYRRVVEWRNFELLSFEEIGRRLGRSTEAASKLWGRALKQLSQLVEPEHDL